jgi:hypothetical protein
MADDTIKVDILTDSTSSTKSMIKYAAAVGGATLAVNKILNISKELIATYKQEEQANAKLAATLKATGNAAGFSFGQLKSYAGSLQDITTFGDEVIVNGLSILSTFKSIQGDAFKRTTEAALDLSAVMGQDLQSSMVQLGKAVENPTVGLTALSRVGVTFTEQEKEQIKALQEANKLQEAQAVILSAVEGQFKGAAQALANTPTGKLEQLNNALSDMNEQFGRSIVEGINPFVEKMLAIVKSANNARQSLYDLKLVTETGIGGKEVDTLKSALVAAEASYAALKVSAEDAAMSGLAGASKAEITAAQNLVSNLKIQIAQQEYLTQAKLNYKNSVAQTAELEKIADEERAAQLAIRLEEEQAYFDASLAANAAYWATKSEEETVWKQALAERDEREKESAEYEAELQNQKLEASKQFFGGWAELAALGAEKSFALAVAFKALASAEAAVNSYLAFTKALASAPWPFNIAAASGVLAAGLAQQIKINATPMPKFAQGGDFITSGPQAIMVGDNATGRERVKVEPLGANSEGSRTLIIPITLNGRELGRAITLMSKDGTIITSARSVR